MVALKSKLLTALRHLTAEQLKVDNREGAVELTSPDFRDDFSSETADLRISASGHRWSVLPANGSVRVLPVIDKGFMTAEDSGLSLTAAYAAINLGKTAKRVRATVSFAAGRVGGGAAIILTRTLRETSDIGHIVKDGSVHVVFTSTKVLIGLFKDYDFQIVKVLRLPRKMRGSLTPRAVGYDVEEDVLRIRVSGCQPVELKHFRIRELSGPYVTFEAYWASGQCRAQFHSVAAQ
jgi:hypothetical protein